MSPPNDCRIDLPEGFDGYAWEVEAKGWLPDVLVTIGDRRYRVTFYDPVRLAQDIEAELAGAAAFYQSNLVIVPRVTRAHMESAIRGLAESGAHHGMVVERSSVDE